MFVYVISATPERHKIGIAADPSTRVRALQTGSGDPLELIYVAKVPHARAVEQLAHHLVRAQRLVGEWFEVGSQTAIASIHEAISSLYIVDPEWLAFGGWGHSVGDVVECRTPGERLWPGPKPVVGERYTVSAVYPEGQVDVVEIANDDVAYCASMFWPAFGRIS